MLSEDPTRATPLPAGRELPTHGSVGPSDPHADPATKPVMRPADLDGAGGDGTATDPGMRAVAVPDTPAPDAPTVPTKDTPTAPPAVITRTRTGGLWTGMILSAIVGIVLLVFILQNLDPVQIYFLGFAGTLPVGVALLFAAIAGLLVVAIPGGLRMLQLRRAARRGARR